MITWEFPHAVTGALCKAVFDGALLEIEVMDADYDPNDWEVDAYSEVEDTAVILSGTMRTCCANRDAAYRELRLHADSIDLDRSETHH